MKSVIKKGLTPWKPGQSGNPAGRPKGSLNLTTVLKHFLKEKIEVEKDGKIIKLSKDKVLILKLIEKAIKGDIKAIEKVWDRIEGKPIQPNINIEGELINISDEEIDNQILEAEKALAIKGETKATSKK